MTEAFIERFSRGKSPTKAEESAFALQQILEAKALAVHFYPIHFPDRLIVPAVAGEGDP